MKTAILPVRVLGYPAIPLFLFLAVTVIGAIWLWRGRMVEDVEERN